jgi:hypothetical protein
MPESCTDRPTSAWEPVFLLTKSAKYFYDQEAVKEESEYPDDDRKSRSSADQKRMPTEKIAGIRPGSAIYPKRNLRNVWHLGPEPFPESHFAVFPTAIPRICIKAGTSEKGVCPKCGAPWCKVVRSVTENRSNAAKAGTEIEGKGHVSSQVRDNHDVRNGPVSITETIGWKASCQCNAGNAVPATCLDPFAGAGTTLLVADELQRDCIGIELSPAYAEMARKRIQDASPLFANIAAD